MTDNNILAIQISTNLINGDPDKNDIATKYYNTIYDKLNKDGYYRGSDFWEIPLWVTELDFNAPVDFYVCTNINDTIQHIIHHNYKYVCFSVLEVNKEIISNIITECNNHKHNSIFVLGGYIDFTKFYHDKTIYPKSIKDFITFLGIEYKQGYSYRLFKGYKTIPRLTLSTGCLNNCDFCTVEKTLTKTNTNIVLQQIDAFKPLTFKLVYINDKTFGQCANYALLPRLYQLIKEYNKDFEGFIIQTTTGQLLNLSDDFIKCSHIKFIELGIESFNNSILKKYHKPSNELLSNNACKKIQGLHGVKLIANIICGMPEETIPTYLNTMNFIKDNINTISHLNIYSLAVYDNTPLSKRIKISNNDSDENTLDKSFLHGDHHKQFYNAIHTLGINILNR